MTELHLQRVDVRREGGDLVLQGVDLVIAPGEAVAVMGASGSGKTTLALTLAGLLAPAAGAVAGRAAGRACVALQRPEASFLRERVVDEVALAAVHRGAAPEQAAAHAVELLARLGLPPGVAERDPLTLSGGEQRRVAIAAVLAADPRVLVLDEPGAGLDERSRGQLHAALGRLRVEAGERALVVVTHDPSEAVLLADRLVVLRAGRVAFDGPIRDVLAWPHRARELGVDVVPEVALLHDVAAQRGLAVAGAPAAPAEALAELARLLAGAEGTAHATPSAPAHAVEPAPDVAPAALADPRARLPWPVDARVRCVAALLAVVAALAAGTLVAAAVVAAATAVVVALARIERRRVRFAVRPLLFLTVTLVLLQLLFGRDVPVALTSGHEVDVPGLAAVLRALQAAAVVLASLALSVTTPPTDLAAALRWLLAPLRVVRVPVASMSFVVATSLGLVPTLADELERLRLAQRARGIRPPRPTLRERAHLDTALLGPLFVASFRRAHLLADALVVRGVDPRRAHVAWRARRTPSADVGLLLGGVALLALSRLV